MISIIIPVKELNNYLFETILNYKLNIKCKYEIIIVYDITSGPCYNKFNSQFNEFYEFTTIVPPFSSQYTTLRYTAVINCLSIPFKLIDIKNSPKPPPNKINLKR